MVLSSLLSNRCDSHCWRTASWCCLLCSVTYSYCWRTVSWCCLLCSVTGVTVTVTTVVVCCADIAACLQVQRAVQEADPGVGSQPVEHVGHHRDVADRTEPVGLPGGSVCGRGHRQAAATGNSQHTAEVN